MTKTVYIVHGWSGHPNEGWFPWLKRELEKKSFKVIVPKLPDSENPRIYQWIPALSKVIKNPDRNTYLVSHSMGCQAIARYLEGLPPNVRIGGIVFVAGFFKHLTGLEDDPQVQKTDMHWLQSPIDFSKVKSHITRSIAIFSDDDPYVPLDNQDDFKNKLGSKIVIAHNKGHFSANLDKAFEAPIVLKSLLEIAR